MRLRDLVSSGVCLLVALLHSAAQWYGWKLHLGEIAPGPGADPNWWWHTCSFPLFVVVPGRYHYLHFLELLAANSAVWGLTAAWLAHKLQPRGRRRPSPRARTSRGSVATGHNSATRSQTATDRMLELKRLRDRGDISREEYLRQRETVAIEVPLPGSLAQAGRQFS